SRGSSRESTKDSGIGYLDDRAVEPQRHRDRSPIYASAGNYSCVSVSIRGSNLSEKTQPRIARIDTNRLLALSHRSTQIHTDIAERFQSFRICVHRCASVALFSGVFAPLRDGFPWPQYQRRSETYSESDRPAPKSSSRGSVSAGGSVVVNVLAASVEA